MRYTPLAILLLLTSAAPALAQAAALPSPAPHSDGAVTFDAAAGRTFPVYPPLPPNSGDLVYDSGDYTGSSRNLQNADINPGWPYWAHQVRFTPVAGMNGPLLEVRYVAAVQWGTNRDYDLVIRGAGGTVVATLPNQTAVIDTGNWQVVNVSSLNFVPGSQDFYVELRPTNACAGVNGFTIPFSTLGSARSAFTSDCLNPFASFSVEGRDLFVRAVVSLGGPKLSVSGLVAGGTATVSVTGATGGGQVGVAYSLAGGGPSSLSAGPCGMVTVALSNPIVVLPILVADPGGNASLSQSIPAGTTGTTVWLHALDVSSCTLTNSLTQVIG